MRHLLTLVALAAVLACHNSTGPIVTPPPAIDPFMTVRVTNSFDPASDYGRTPWRIYSLLSGPQVNLNGVAYAGQITPADVAAGRNKKCIGIQSDSIGTRILTVVAIGNVATHQPMTDAEVDAIVEAYRAGNHTLPTGVVALVAGPTDAWNSAQFAAGHGLNPNDPIKWGWDWTGSTTTNFAERTDSSDECNRA